MKKLKPILSKVDIDWLIESIKIVFPTKDESIKKMNEINNKLDTFIGEIKARREEQILHDGSHQRVDKRLIRLENHAHLQPIVD